MPLQMTIGMGARHRIGVAARVLAAAAGGYGLTAIATALLTVLLPMLPSVSRADATIIATLSSFAIYTCVVIWVFAVASAWRAWAGILLASGVLGAALMIYRGWQ
jgi:hypothetical protein